MKFQITLLLALALINSAFGFELLAKVGKSIMQNFLPSSNNVDSNVDAISDLNKMLQNIKINANMESTSNSGQMKNENMDMSKTTDFTFTLSIGTEIGKTLKKCAGADYAKNTIDAASDLLNSLQKDLESNKCNAKVKDAWAKLKTYLLKSLDFVKNSQNLLEALKTLFNEKVSEAAMELFNALYEMVSNGASIFVLLSQTINSAKAIFYAIVKRYNTITKIILYID